MPLTRQHIERERPMRQIRLSEGVVIHEENIQQFLADYERMNRTKATAQFYRRKLKRFYEDLPEDKIVRHSILLEWQMSLLQKGYTLEAVRTGKIVCDQNKYKQVVTIPVCLQKELLDFAKRNGILFGLIFQTKDGRPMHLICVSTLIRSVCEEAQIPSERGSADSLRKMYLSTRSGIESNIALLVEQAMERMMEREQFSIGWDEGNG